MDASTVWIAIGSCATGLMAVATFLSIWQNTRHRKEDQRQRDIDEALELVKKFEEAMIECGSTNNENNRYAVLCRISLLSNSIDIIINRLRITKLIDLCNQLDDKIIKIDPENNRDNLFEGFLQLTHKLKLEIAALKNK